MKHFQSSFFIFLLLILATFITYPGSGAVKEKSERTDRAIFAGGCFWGVEYYMQKQPGVVKTTAGYCGGTKQNPSSKEVSAGNTGHVESVEVVFDPGKTSYEKLARLFFEIHDPTTQDRQGADVGEEYRSEIFYLNETQKRIAEKLIVILQKKGYKVVTRVSIASPFYPAEKHHQNYYRLKNKPPACHFYTKRF